MAEEEEPKQSWLGDVLPKPYRDMMRQHLLRSADEILRRRMPPYSLEAWQLRRQQVQQELIAALGGFPERTPLNARIISTHQLRGYRIENVVFESQPGFYVTASVFVPDSLTRPAPAVLCPHGHWPDGRCAEAVQRRCVGLARRGYVALSLDAVGYNDREVQGHRRSWYLFSAGLTLQGIEVWDNMRAIDYLCSRDDVDPERIGCTGCSGGGNQTMYVSALDERIKAAVPVCSVEVISDYMEKAFCTCETIPGLVGIADLTEITALIAPRALLLVHGVLDTGFPILSARLAAARIRDIYRFYDPERFATYESYSGHDYNLEMRQAMYAWFDRWLMGRETDGEEEAPGKELLRVLPEGLPPDHARLASLFLSRVKQLPGVPEPESPQEFRELQRAIGRGLKDVLGGFPSRASLKVQRRGSDQWRGYRRERLWLRSEPDIIVPAVMLQPTSGGPFDVFAYIMAGGKESLSEQEALSRLEAGQAVFAFDLRNTGETQSAADHVALSALALGRPLVGMQVWDTIRCLEYLRLRSDVNCIHLVGKGSLAASMVALLAGLLDRQATSVSLEALPASLRLPYVAQEVNPLYLPSVLGVADIPDMIAALAPRQAWVQALLDEELQPLCEDSVRQALRHAFKAYELLEAAHALVVGHSGQ